MNYTYINTLTHVTVYEHDIYYINYTNAAHTHTQTAYIYHTVIHFLVFLLIN